MKKIYVLRSAPYNYSIEGYDLYDSFDMVIKKIYEPSLEKMRKIEFEKVIRDNNISPTLLISAPEKRSIETANIFNKKGKISELLNEVNYEMEDFISKAEFYKDGKPDVNKARQLFVKALIDNQLQEEYASVIERIENIFELISKNKSKEVVLISHGFFIKIIESYIRDNKIKQNPLRLLKYFSGKTETFKFCEGFFVENIDNDLKFKKYIRSTI